MNTPVTGLPMASVKWHESHNVEHSRPFQRCGRCGLYLEISNGKLETWNRVREGYDYFDLAAGPCTGRRYFSKNGSPVFIPYDLPPKRKMPKFWHSDWCSCEKNGHGEALSIGYELARWSYKGMFCHACDTEYTSGKEHCHCAGCGGINQVG